MAERGEGVPAPNHNDNTNKINNNSKYNIHKTSHNNSWSNFKPEFSGKPDEEA